MSALEPIRQSSPITASFITTALMPTRLLLPIVQPCSTALWPIVTLSPKVTGKPASMWTTALSCTLLRWPMRMLS